MAIATRTLKDTVVETGGGASGGKVTILVNMDDNTTANSNILDASGLSGHANGAKLDITRIWWSLVQGTADDNTGHVQLQFKGASSDTVAIQLAGTGHYDGTAGAIKGTAVNTTATSSDITAQTATTSGFVILEFKKDGAWVA